MELRQTDINFSRNYFRIDESGLFVFRKGIASSSETFIDFEDVGSKRIKENTRKILWLVLAGLSLLLGIAVFFKRINGGSVGKGAEIFYAVVSLLFLFIFLYTRKSILYLTQPDNSSAIGFFASKLHQKKLNFFIETLIQSRNEYLLQKYMTLKTFLPYEQQHGNLVWLYNLKLISEEELQNKISELNKLDLMKSKNQDGEFVRIAGFRNTNLESTESEEEL
jgi:hypothetical protein